ncbi:MAG TPA: amino acid adenylation domain-containing protein [Thermoanaerobaculia bacterium]|nr:amino acid adenylation domain-containing protein [Thermoanaerobaculia bacterium]
MSHDDLLSLEGLELLDLLLEEQGIETGSPAERIGRRHDPAELPLSFAQQRLWFLDQWRPRPPDSNINSAFRLEGDLDPGVLARALSEVVRRHEVLRCVLRTVDGKPLQVLLPPRRFALPVVDLEGLPEAEILRLVGEEARRPFDLAAGPLLRATVLRLGDRWHVLLITQHHVVSDGWSMGIFVREVVTLYGAFAAGLSSSLPELQIQYADFAAWQRRRLQGESLEELLGWWRERLAGAPELLELPADRPRPPVQGWAGATLSFFIPAGIRDALSGLAQSEGATLFMVLLAGFDTLLQRYTGRDDLLVGSPVANRNRDETEGLIGFFVNTLVLRADLSGDPVFRELVGGVRDVTLGVYDHQDVPFEMLVDELGLAREVSHTPLFQVVFALQNAPAPTVAVPELSLTPLPAHSGTSKFDLTLSMTELPDGLVGSFEYSTDLFDRATIARLAGHFETLLAGIAAGPDRRLSKLPLLTAEERRRIEAWSAAEAAFPVGESLHRRFEAQAARTPGATAVAGDGNGLTYAGLDAYAGRLTARLRALGVGPESRVGLLAERTPALVAGVLGILKAGGAYVPLDPAHPDDRLAYTVTDSGARVVVAGPGLAERLSGLDLEIVPLEDAASEPAPSVDVDPGQAAYVIYTSGSTGRPKGVVVTHANVLRLFAATDGWFGFGPGDVWTLFHSYAFDFSVWEIWGALLYGGRLVVVPYLVSRSPEAFLQLLAAERVTVLNQTPSAFRQLIQADRDTPSELALRWVVFGGEALDLKSLAPWFERHGDRTLRLVNMYGITETTVHVTFRPVGESDLAGGSVLGRPIPDLSLHLLDRHGAPVPVGVPGEMHIGGAGVARGYLGRPALTAERFVPDAFGARLYRSGDLARRRPDGDLEYLGRIDHQVKVRGFRIELGEIEAAIAERPEVRQAVVLPREESGETRLTAYVVPAGEKLSTAALWDELRKRLPDYMVPAAWVVLEALPLTPNGKLDRRALPTPGPARRDPGEDFAAPSNPIEELLAAVWAQVLGVDRVGVRDNFFALGGDSIRSIQVLALARERGLEFSLQQLFQYQTVEALAAELAPAAEGVDAGLAGEPFSLVSAADRARLPEGVEDAYPLAALQEGMLFHMVLASEDAPYHNIDSWLLEARFEADPFQRAVDAIVARHAVLRTSFHLEGFGEPLQLVHRAASLPVAVEDLRHLPWDEQEAMIDAFVAAEKRRLLDLGRAPQLRMAVHRRSETAFQFTLTENHAIFDGWSLHSTLSELFGHYFTLLDGQEPREEPAPAVAYRDFVRLERETAASEEARRFWERSLAGIEVTEIPRWPVPYRAGGVRSFDAVATLEVSERLHRLARAAAVPLKSVLLAAHLRVLALASGRSDVVTGLVANGRPEVPGGDRLRGLFLNTLPLRLRLEGGSWMDLARQAFAAEWEQLPYRRYPLALLQQERGGRPLFEVMFNYIHFYVVEDLLGSGDVQVLGMKRLEGTSYPLQVALQPGTAGRQVGVSMEYDAKILHDEQVQAMSGWFQRVLAAMVADPDGRYETAGLLTEAEQHQVLLEWNDTAADFPEGFLHDAIAAQAARTPDAAALVFEETSLSYAELMRRAGRLAAGLRRSGVGPETRVGISVERSLEMVVGLLGILKAGGAYVPIDPSYPAERLEFMLADARLPVVLDRERLLAFDAPDTGTEAPALGPSQLAYVIYTSGSTGRPKGAMNSHAGIVNRLLWMQREYGLTPADRVLQKTPFSFDVSVWELFWPLLTGACLVVARPGGHQDAAYLVETIAEREVTTLHFVPSMLRLFLEERDLGRCTALRRVLASGEALPTDLRQRFFERLGGWVELHNLYGPTEAAVDVTFQPCEGSALPVVPIGRPVANTRIHLLDGHFQPVPIGTPGELYIGGVQVGRGYHDRPAFTAERFVPDLFGGPGARLYRTGDLARLLPDGAVDFLGRLDHQVKVRGFRIELGEIESALALHPGVREAAVLADARAGEIRLVGYVVPRPEAGDLAPAALREHLLARLPEPMVPALWVFLDQMPLSPSGKLDRRALPAPDGALRSETEYMAPRNAVEQELAAIWARLLGVASIGIHDNFFALGGHSLLAHRVLAAVREGLRAEIELRALFENPTVAGLAGVVSGAQAPVGPTRIPRQPRTLGEPDHFPVSFSQLREWILHQIEPDSPAYNIPGGVRATGPLSIPRLNAAVQEIVRRHETLRTHFEGSGGEPVQVVAPRLEVLVPLVDLDGLPEPLREPLARQLAQANLAQPFALARGPLLRLLLVRLSPAEHLVLFVMHHIISDGWSVGVFSRELTALYAASVAGLPSPLPELPVQYADFTVWQREHFHGERLEQHLDYWRRQLAGLPPLLRLPADRPRPPVQTYHGARQPLLVSRDESAAVRALAAREGTSPFVVLLAAFQTLLGRWSHEEDLAVGTFSGSRGHLDLEGLIGFFVNTLVLRGDLSGDPTFSGLVRRLREVTLGAYDHGEVPYERLLESLRVERTLSHTPLFQVMMLLQSFPAPDIEPGEVALSPFNLEDDQSNFDLSLWWTERDDGFAGLLEHNLDLFDPATIRRLGGQLHALLRAALADPERPISELPLMVDAERHQVLLEWNDSAALAEAPPPVHRLFQAAARRSPEAPALVWPAGEMTYQELAQRTGRLARRLRQAGAGPEAIVGVFLDRSPELIAALLAVLEAGAAYLPLDPDYPADRLAFLLEDSGAGLLLTRETSSLPEHRAAVVRVDGDEDAPAFAQEVDPDEAVYVLYTSGSTGRPKGVVVRHGSLARYVETARLAYGLTPDDRVLQFASIGFDTSAEEIYPCLAAGATLVLRSGPRAEEVPEFLAGVERLGITVLDLPTAYWHEIVAALDRDASLAIPPRVRLVILGGERALPARVRAWRERVPHVRLVNTYGPTEGTIVATHADLSEALWDARIEAEVPIGRPVRDVRTFLLDRELRPVPLGVWGELCLGGGGLARGYLGRPALTAERFVPSSFGPNGERLYRTGDLARFRPDGSLEFCGRIDFQIKVRGVRVEPGEVEAALARHPALREAAAGALFDPAGGARLVAWVVAHTDPPPTVSDLRGFLLESLPEAMVPSAFVTLPALPLLPNGKVDWRALPAPGGDRPELGTAYTAPESDLERAIAEVWQDLLRVDRIGLDDNFFDLGGHSLLLVQAQGRLREALGREVAVVDLFRFPTVKSLARHLGGADTGAAVKKAQNLGEKQRSAIGKQRQAMAAVQSRLKKR